MARPDTRPLAALPEPGIWWLIRWEEYQGHHITLAKTPQAALNAYRRRCLKEKSLLEIKDTMVIETGNPSHKVLAHLARAQYMRMLDRFQIWVRDQALTLIDEDGDYPTGFFACTEYTPPKYMYPEDITELCTERHLSCELCRGSKIRAITRWEDLFTRAGHLWPGNPEKQRPFDVRRPSLEGEVELCRIGSYGVHFTPIPKDLRGFNPNTELLFFFVRRDPKAFIPGLAEFQAEFEKIQQDKDARWHDRQKLKEQARMAQKVKDARQLMKAMEP